MRKSLKTAFPFLVFLLALGLLAITNKSETPLKKKQQQCSGKCNKGENKSDQTLYNPINRLIVSL